MIIRKPTKIELKVENDIGEYEQYREKMMERLRNNKQSQLKRDDLLFNNLLTNDQLRNRSYLFDPANSSERGTIRSIDFMTPQNPAELRRNIYQISGERYYCVNKQLERRGRSGPRSQHSIPHCPAL
jgi:hypothetical protein